MKKNESLLKVIITLPEGFKEELEQVAIDELKIAQKKWGVRLDEEQKKRILYFSMIQLEKKVEAVTKFAWDINTKVINMTVGSTVERTIYLPEEENSSHLKNEYIIRSNEDWKIDYEPTSDSTPLSELHLKLQQEILQWYRTAIFYGTGSYSQ